MTKQRDLIYVTEFKNQFDFYRLLHATRSKEKAYIDAGNSGRVIECIEHAAIEAKDAEIEGLKEQLKEVKEVFNHQCEELREVVKDFDHTHIGRRLSWSLVSEYKKLKEQLKESESVIKKALISFQGSAEYNLDNYQDVEDIFEEYLKNRGER